MAKVTTTNPGALASPSKPTENLFDFQVIAPSRRPRAWERTPKSPFATHPRGRKVWKRYELRGRGSAPEASAEVSETADGESSNSVRPVKRLRVKQPPIAAGEAPNQKPATSYITTLHEIASGTPKRKLATRKSLKPDRLRPMRPRKSGITKNPGKVSVLSPAKVYMEEALPQVEEPPLLENHGSGQIDDTGDETAESHLPEHVENTCADIENEISSDIPSYNTDEDVPKTSSVVRSAGDSDDDLSSLDEATTENHQAVSVDHGFNFTSSSIENFVIPPAMQIEAQEKGFEAPSSNNKTFASPLEDSVDSPRDLNQNLPDAGFTVVTPIEVRSPVASPSKESQLSLLTSCGQTLAETSERSISATAGAASTDDSTNKSENSLEGFASAERQKICISEMSPTKDHHHKSFAEQIIVCNLKNQQIESVANEESLPINSFDVEFSDSGGESISAGDDTIGEPSRRISSLDVETCELSLFHSLSEDESVELPSDFPTRLVKEGDAVANNGQPDTNADDAKIKRVTEREEEPKTTQEQIEGSGRRTRSTTRFSDDTKMLKDFVSRVQARKAAKDIQILVPVAAPMTSLRRSPRKPLAEVDKNSPSPQKPHDLANRPGTPPGDRLLGTIDSDDLDEIAVEQTTCRRSTRTRLFAPSTTAAGAPSCIPVRRAKGETILPLPKSDAQAIAIVTRANTKRNKGQSKPPKVTLQSLPADTLADAIARPGGRGDARAVGWDETLVYYQDRSDWKEGKVEKRARVRRMRNLGTTNGTPARKKLGAETDDSTGASAARGRSKSKGKV